MPTHKKGHDKDKYYHLAKDQGFRARSAFKLIQINKRFGFLRDARVCLDLCAAPGGWCQVAAKEMPKGSLIIGVDLLPIRPMRGVQTLVNDITTADCRRNVNNLLTGWKCDVVLCDGAPNIGSNYQKDAYVQNELVLAALRTATDHLAKGGTFCSKIYRSVDYESLIWVFQQMFEDVQTIKPSSSRSQSSEIFVVCLKYTKPDKIDPKFLDPDHVFKEVRNDDIKKIDVMHKKYEKHNKRHRAGYETEGVLIIAEGTVSDFVESKEPLRILTDKNVLNFTSDCDRYKESKYTTAEVIECFKDLRVLGKTDFRKLLKWRQRMRDMDKVKQEANGAQPVQEIDLENDAPQNEEDREAAIYEKIMEDRQELLAKEKRLKKKERENKAKQRARAAFGMNVNAFDETTVDQDLFRMDEGAMDEDVVNGHAILDDKDDPNNEGTHFYKVDEWSRHKQARDMAEVDDDEYNEDYSSEEQGSVYDSDMEAPVYKNGATNVDMEDDEAVEGAAEQWFSHSIFKQTVAYEEEEDEDEDEMSKSASKSKVGIKRSRAEKEKDEEEEWDTDKRMSKNVQEIIDNMPKTDKQVRSEKRKKEKERKERRDAKRASKNGIDPNAGKLDIVDGEDSDDGFQVNGTSSNKKDDEGSGFEIAEKEEFSDDSDSDSSDDEDDNLDRTTTLALGTLALRKSKRAKMIEDSYNRYTFNDSKSLPDWFVDDESKANSSRQLVPSQIIENIKNKGRATGGKDIKKAAEAVMRKKKRTMKKLQQAKKQATMLAEDSEMSDKQKLRAISKAMKNGQAEKSNKVYVVSAKNKAGSSATRLGSGNGKLKFVDKRMKADKRGERAAKKRQKKGRKKR